MLAVSEATQLIDRIVEKTVRGYQPERILLFGSHAYGEPDDQSDVDLLIIKDDSRSPAEREFEIRKLLREENSKVGLSLLAYSPSEVQARLRIGDDFFQEIMRRGILLYEREG